MGIGQPGRGSRRHRVCAESLASEPREGRTAWFSGTANARTATLTVPVPASARPLRLSWQQFVDTEASDLLTLQVSGDGGTTWTTLPYRLGAETVDGPYAISGLRRWQSAAAEIPAGTTAVRWTYVQDAGPVRPRASTWTASPSGTGAGSWSTPSTIPTA